MRKKQTTSRYNILAITFLAAVSVVWTSCQQAEERSDIPDHQQSTTAAVTWLLRENQGADGGFGIDFNTGEPSSTVASTVDAVLALSAAGFDAGAAYCGVENSTLDFLKVNKGELLEYAAGSGGANGKIILALVSANQNAQDFMGHDFVAQLREQFDPSGAYNSQAAFDQALAILALSAVDEPVQKEAIMWLENLQSENGSWDDGFGTEQNADATAMAVMALLAEGKSSTEPSVASALAFLETSQLETGGWEYGQGFGENANSTALALQALTAAGENAYDSDSEWVKNGRLPVDALLAWQDSNGAFQADFGQGRFDDAIATLQAIPAVAGKPYPLPKQSAEMQNEVVCLTQ